MGFKPFHWLEIAEIGLLGLTTLGLIVAIASGPWQWAAIALWLTLTLNILNRLRGEWLTRQQIRSLKHQQRQLLDEKLNFPVPESVSSLKGPLSTAPTGEIQSLRQTVARLEQSLAQVWQAIPRHPTVESLEKREIAVNLPESFPAVPLSPPPNLSNLPNPLNPPNPPLPLPEIKLPPSAIVSWQPDRLLKEHRDRVAALSLSGDGRYLVSGSWDQTIKVWDLKEGRCLGTMNAHDQGVQAVVFTGEGKIATGSYDQNLKIWCLEARESGKIVLHLDMTLTAHTGSVHALAVADNGKLLVSGSYDQTIKRWNLEKGELLVSSYDPSGAIAAVALAPQQQWIASAGGDGLVTLWQMTDNAKIMTLSGNVASVDSLAVSLDGQTLAAGCSDGTIKLWAIPEGGSVPPGKLLPVGNLSAHIGQVACLCFSPEGHNLYSAGVDGLIKLWHPNQREPLATLIFPSNSSSRRRGVFSLLLTPDGQRLIAGGDNGTIQIWTRDSVV